MNESLLILIILFILKTGHAGSISQWFPLNLSPLPPEVEDQSGDGSQQDEKDKKHQAGQVPLL